MPESKAGEQERARERIESWKKQMATGKRFSNASCYCHADGSLNEEGILAFAAAEVALAVAECCAAVCDNCRDKDLIFEPATLMEGGWRHKVKPEHGGGSFNCYAAAIHERGGR